jgi:shikimate 5-dehydrogenase
VRRCLAAVDEEGRGRGRLALVVSAGGASRAAVYALGVGLGCRTVYMINREESEVELTE